MKYTLVILGTLALLAVAFALVGGILAGTLISKVLVVLGIGCGITLAVINAKGMANDEP